ncbi:type 4a pilus biogenesis protein PilO [Candidatus Daviesbacteria bacterium]|nr:type 4a pilus biogenesis protein PilO [Candidatus Daviesbacteria bacterium]
MVPQYSRYYIYIKPVFQSKVVKTYGTLVFSLFTITMFGLFAIRPTLTTIIALQRSIKEQQAVLDKLNGKIETLSLGKKNFENLSPESKTKIFTLLPNSTSLPTLVDELSALALEKQASISGLQFQPVDLKSISKELSKEAKLQNIEFTINLQGSYPQLTDYINSLTKLNRLITIKSVGFNKPAGGNLTVSINAKAYFIAL